MRDDSTSWDIARQGLACCATRPICGIRTSSVSAVRFALSGRRVTDLS